MTMTPEIGALVEVRGQRWVVAEVDGADNGGESLVDLQSVEDGRYGETLSVIWEVEPGRRILPAGSLPELTRDGFDAPARLAAFLDAVRWSAVTSADVRTLQAPFRSGVAIEDYQLEPVARAVEAPRVNLLLADDVGLGKTIEAGLVALELLLRHRARRVMIVCPAGLTTKWQDEMAAKFGLDFTVVDSEECARLRRTHGSAANPFNVHPLTIVSLAWLRGPKAQRLLDEVLPPEGPTYPRTFDLLILDEAHHVAPAAPNQAYAVDSQQTKLMRRLAPHFEHRLFLSATPHNGYPESFTALLELIDDQRFARGVEPDPAALRDTVVRRLKTTIVDADGRPRFPERRSHAIPVEFPEDERRIHGLLSRYAELRRRRIAASRRGRKATDLVTLLLKKRLFSSPAAFAHTVGVHVETLESRAGRAVSTRDDVPEWLEGFFDDVATLDDELLAEAEDDALGRSGSLQPGPEPEEIELLEEMERWAGAHEARPDAKAHALLDYLTAVCRPDGTHWTNERVVVFTEYRDTQIWLEQILRQEGMAGDRLALLHGGMSAEDRELLRLAFQAEPAENPVRILLATDAASEGIDLQRHCHRLVNYDIPFNPNKLEQRIGRIDRYGQPEIPEIYHFVGTGWEKAADTYEADLEFLARVAKKVARMEEDLGAVNAVLAEAVQRRMLGEIRDFDVERAAPAKPGRRRKAGGTVAAATDVGEQVRRLHTELDETVRTLGITPSNVERVVATALELARQQPLQPLPPHLDERRLADGLYAVPPLTGSWSRAADGLIDKLTGQQLPVTFDQQVARDRDDVVLAHLGHPLVAMSTRLLRAAVWNSGTGLHRVTAVLSDDPGLETVLVGAFARFVMVGADGVRLHEEVLYAGGWLRDGSRFARLENLTVLGGLLDRALAHGSDTPGHIRSRLYTAWPRVRDGLVASLEWRKGQRRESLANKLDKRQEDESRRIEAGLDRFAATLRAALQEEPDDGQLALELRDSRELAQARRDRHSWEERLRGLDEVRERELELVDARYRDPQSHLFPVAVVFVVPTREASR